MVQQVKMSVCWMFMILLGCRLFHATQSHNTCTCNEELHLICGPGKDEVCVPCPNVTADEVGLNLFQNKELISNLTCIRENISWTCQESHSRGWVKLHERNPFSFILFGLNDSSQGSYRCESKIIYPPPLKTVPSKVRIHVLMRGNQCQCHKDRNKHENPSLEFMWIWIVVVVLLTIYSLSATVIAFVIWVKLRKTDSQSDYMNTIPRAPRDRRRKKGVQNPIPRHF